MLTSISTLVCSRKCLKYLFTALLLASGCAGQTAQPPQSPANPFSQEISQYPGLVPEFGKLAERLRNEVQPPVDRSRSQVLPVLPESTTYYVAAGNYGDAAHQALRIFRDELRQSAVLRAWWEHTVKGADAAKFEDGVEKFYELSQYLGDEIVVAGNAGTKNVFAVIAPVRKPGLKSFLAGMIQQWPGLPRPMVRVVDPQELTAPGNDKFNQKTPVILVRTDFVIAAPDLETLRTFNGLLNTGSENLVSTAFGARLAQAYQDGTGFLAAADLQKILLALGDAGVEPPQTQAILTQTGFDNVKFLVWQHKGFFGQAGSQMEISFDGPRHGIPAWLTAPGDLGSLDFVSSKAVMVWTVRLRNLGEIFDDVRKLATLTNPQAFASFDQMQQMLGVDLRNDLLSHLDGEISFELDGVTAQQPEWKAILRVNDPERLQQALGKLLAASGQSVESSLVDGINYYSFLVPSPRTAMQVSYAFADGFMVIGSSQKLVTEGIQARRSGMSLAKSSKFLSSAKGGAEPVSAFMYYDPTAMWSAKMQSATPDVAQLFSNLQSTPVVVRTYAEPDRIRVASNSGGADAGAIMVIAAIAVPNLLRARISANESSAVGTMRNVITAQVAYSITYPSRKFARDLVSLGSAPGGSHRRSAEHAGLLDWNDGDSSCSERECVKSGYRFAMSSRCTQDKCEDFIALATPLSSNTGARSFCATSDGVMRFNLVTPSAGMISSAECRIWAPLR